MKLEKLGQKFRSEDLEWRVQASGIYNNEPWAIVVPYVTNRAIMDRLDAICGADNWQNVFEQGPGGGVICGIAIRVSRQDGPEWITKWDGAENTKIESVKGGLSGAMKRAAVHWGIGRYLYQLEISRANIHPKGSHRDYVLDNIGKKIYYHWDPPILPEWAVPDEERKVRLNKNELRDLSNRYGGWEKVKSDFSDALPDKPISEWTAGDYAMVAGTIRAALDENNQ